MKIAILGSGAMGMLFGGYLSKENDVILIDIDHNKDPAMSSSLDSFMPWKTKEAGKSGGVYEHPSNG